VKKKSEDKKSETLGRKEIEKKKEEILNSNLVPFLFDN
jgi:hypothetical protein